MNKLYVIPTLFVLSMLALGTVSAAAYIKFDGIDGESKDSAHDKWIDVLSIDWGIHQPGNGATGQSRRRGDVVMDDIQITKEVDKSTPKLLEALTTGKTLPDSFFDITYSTSSDGRPETYLRYHLKNVQVTSYNIGSSGEDGVNSKLVETFTLNFEEVKMEYIDLDSDDDGDGIFTFMWKLLRNRR